MSAAEDEMSNSLALAVPGPRVFDVMGCFIHLEVLARVAKVSKTAYNFISPIIESMKRDKQEMYQMMLRLFPGITHLQEGMDTAYYHRLLQQYFTPMVAVPMPETVSSMIENVLINTCVDISCEEIDAKVRQAIETNQPMTSPRLTQAVTGYLADAMTSAEGRRSVLQSIRHWEEAVPRHHQLPNTINVSDGYRLTFIRQNTRLAFSIRNDEIGI